jgi:hypothetical protein
MTMTALTFECARSATVRSATTIRYANLPPGLLRRGNKPVMWLRSRPDEGGQACASKVLMNGGVEAPDGHGFRPSSAYSPRFPVWLVIRIGPLTQRAALYRPLSIHDRTSS